MKHLRVLKHLFKHVPRHFWLHWNFEVKKEKTQVPEEWFMQAMRLKTKLYVWKAFPFGNVLGISNQKFCLNGKCPWCQVWELPQKASSSRLVQNGSTLTKLELLTISSDKPNMLWPSFTLVSNMYYLFFSWHLSYITMTQNKSSSNLEPKHTLLPVSCRHFVTFYQLCSRVDFPLLSATPLDTSFNLS